MATDSSWKGKSIVCFPDSSIPQDISKAKVVLHIGSIKFRGEDEEDEAVPQPIYERSDNDSYSYHWSYFREPMVEPIPLYIIRVCLESSLDVDGPISDWYSHAIRKPILKKEEGIQWNWCGIKFDIDLCKIHELVIKIEVIRFYQEEIKLKPLWSGWKQRNNHLYDEDEEDEEDKDNTPRDRVGTSGGHKVVGRAKVRLWDFLRGENKRKIGADSPLADLLSGDEDRYQHIRLAKMEKDGSGTKHEGEVLFLFKVDKFMPQVQKQAEKKLDSHPYYLQ